LQGVLTEAGLVRIYLRFQAHPEKDSLILHREFFEPVQLIQEREVFPDIVKKVMTAVGNRVVVINSAGAAVGHITAKDILPLFSQKKEIASQVSPSDWKTNLYMYENFVTKSPFAMHSVNSEGQIIMANEMLHLMLGYEYGELLGLSIFQLYPKAVHEKASLGLKTILSQGFHQSISSQMVHKNQSLIDVEIVSRALVNQHQNPIGTVTISRPTEMDYLVKFWPHL
jgi:PAS domain S-box-containing protein